MIFETTMQVNGDLSFDVLNLICLELPNYLE
jgi:hypothetical protein